MFVNLFRRLPHLHYGVFYGYNVFPILLIKCMQLPQICCPDPKYFNTHNLLPAHIVHVCTHSRKQKGIKKDPLFHPETPVEVEDDMVEVQDLRVGGVLLTIQLVFSVDEVPHRLNGNTDTGQTFARN